MQERSSPSPLSGAHRRLDDAGVVRYSSAPVMLSLEARIDVLLDRLQRRTHALRQIRDEQGKVCDDFEACSHTGCTSSYASWAIADMALADD